MPLLFKMFISRLPPIHRPAFICEPEDTGTPYSSNHRDTIHATGHLVLLPLSVHPESLRSSTVQPSASRNHACPLSVKMVKLRCLRGHVLFQSCLLSSLAFSTPGRCICLDMACADMNWAMGHFEHRLWYVLMNHQSRSLSLSAELLYREVQSLLSPCQNYVQNWQRATSLPVSLA